jgi:hypothetical protein
MVCVETWFMGTHTMRIRFALKIGCGSTLRRGYAAKRGSTTRVSSSCPGYLMSDKCSHGVESDILLGRPRCCIFSISPNGVICWSANTMYDTYAAISISGVESLHGYVGTISYHANAICPSRLEDTSEISRRPGSTQPVRLHTSWSAGIRDEGRSAHTPVRPVWCTS